MVHVEERPGGIERVTVDAGRRTACPLRSEAHHRCPPMSGHRNPPAAQAIGRLIAGRVGGKLISGPQASGRQEEDIMTTTSTLPSTLQRSAFRVSRPSDAVRYLIAGIALLFVSVSSLWGAVVVVGAR